MTYTLVATDESVDVPYGTVDDCVHVHFEIDASDMPGFTLEIGWWASSGLGMVKATEPPGLSEMELVSYTAP